MVFVWTTPKRVYHLSLTPLLSHSTDGSCGVTDSPFRSVYSAIVNNDQLCLCTFSRNSPLGPVSWRPSTVKWRWFSQSNRLSPSALDKPSIMKRHHRRWTCSHTSPRRSPTMVGLMLHDIGFVKCRWWNDGWTVKTVVTWRSSASMLPATACSWTRLTALPKLHKNPV